MATRTIPLRRIQERVERAIATLRINDDDLLQIDVNERSISHRLAIYLQQEFLGWHVDCEYNRDVEDPKRLQVSFDCVTDRDIDAKTVFPDIIIHQRRTRENLLVVEIKKSGRDTEMDVAKLKAFTGEGYQYHYGLLLVVRSNTHPSLIWYQDGEEIEREQSKNFSRCRRIPSNNG